MSKNRNQIEALYYENARQHRYMADWRHKIMVRYFLTIAALLFLAKWMWEPASNPLKAFLFVPFLLCALISLAFYLLENRNVQIMRVCEKVGEELEKEWGEIKGFYLSAANIRRSTISYTTIFKIIYLGSTFIFIILATLVIITGI